MGTAINVEDIVAHALLIFGLNVLCGLGRLVKISQPMQGDLENTQSLDRWRVHGMMDSLAE